jgi:protease-4
MWGQVQELRAAIMDVRKAGKPVTAYLESAGAPEYYLASAADRILLMPGGTLDLSGVATYELFFRGALDKLGVVPDLLHIGDYKTYTNTFTEKAMTPAHREMDAALNRDMYDELVRAIAEGRKKSEAEIRDALDGGPYLGPGALTAGLVDGLAYEDQVDDAPPIAGTHRLTAEAYGVHGDAAPFRAPKIAVIYAGGEITSGSSAASATGGSTLGSDTFVQWIRSARADASIRAIVVRIDSPGGSAIASEVMWRELMLTRDVKPLIVSMGDVAASGGYYIAVPAHEIVAQPGTLTGSIGVVTGKFVVAGLLEKLGVSTGVVTDGAMADMNSPFREFTPA